MSILSKIKSLIFKPFSSNNLLNSLDKESDIKLSGNLTLHINNITIDINQDNDVTITGIRFLDLRTETLFLNCDEADKLKQIKLKDSNGLKKKFEMNTSRINSLRKLYETRRPSI